ncbi:MAG: formylglycine-generating enzyme family protein [Verrucomicrobia bacterium]|nr:formylglycine-generating enzyme family protein [Verrucomicrobiota bacterium]
MTDHARKNKNTGPRSLPAPSCPRRAQSAAKFPLTGKKKLSAQGFGLSKSVWRSFLFSFLAVAVLLCTIPFARAVEARFFRIVGPGATTITGISADGNVTWTNAVTNVICTVQAADSLTGASNWVDYVQVPISNHVVSYHFFDANPPVGMAFIPAGSFTMGNAMNPSEGGGEELPLHTVYVSGFFMDKYLVTEALWNEVKAWNGGNGYSYTNSGSAPATNHPVLFADWYDMVKWCNARSEKEGLTPCFYTDAGLSAIYKTAEVTPYVKWDANGYRLPTEAEWEKAARGGASGHRFPWTGTDEISHSRANYNGYSLACDWNSELYYDLSCGYHPTFKDAAYATSPVGYFAPNAYGLYDMAGNVCNRCWDRYGAYSSDSQTDPHGPSAGSLRVMRGGSWYNYGNIARCSNRYPFNPAWNFFDVGFRCVRGH